MFKAHSFLGLWTSGFVFCIVCFSLFFSCRDSEITTPGVLPDSEKLGLLNTDTSSLIAYSLPDDSIRTDETSLNLLGIYNDPVFGVAEASINFQLRLSIENFSFGNPSDLTIDSVVLSLAYYSIYGDTSPQSFKVFELNEDLAKDKNYYSTNSFLTKTPELGSAINVVPRIFDSVLVGGVNQGPQMRISLSNSIGSFLLNTVQTSQTNSAFLNVFKGLQIKPQFSSAPPLGTGAILYLNLQSKYTRLTVFYKDTAEKSYEFLINNDCARTTGFSFNRSGTSIFYNDSVNGDNLLFIQSMSGVKTKIKIPFLGKFVENGRVAVNKAEIIFNLEDNSELPYPPHFNLYLSSIDSSGLPGFLLDQFEGADHYGGDYNATSKQYVFNVTRHIQYLLTNYYEGKNLNFGMYLMAGGKSVNANRTILKGNKNTNPLKFKISYTPL